MRPVLLLILLPTLSLFGPLVARADVELQCRGTVLDSRGSAERKRTASRIRFSLTLTSEKPDAEQALQDLQRRLAAVRDRLQSLDVQDLEVGSPRTWQRRQKGRPVQTTSASLSVRGTLSRQQLQPLVSQVGAIPGVQLSPVRTQADASGDRTSRRILLGDAYQDALDQAEDLAAVMGLKKLVPLQVRVEGGPRPMPRRSLMAADAASSLDPAELPSPVDRLSLQVWFCAR